MLENEGNCQEMVKNRKSNKMTGMKPKLHAKSIHGNVIKNTCRVIN